MNDDRFRHLEKTGEKLTREERKDGWHYCREYDLGLTQGEQIDEQGRCAWCGFDKRKVP